MNVCPLRENIKLKSKMSSIHDINKKKGNKLVVREPVVEKPVVENKTDPYSDFMKSTKSYEDNKHYEDLMCMKDTKSGPRHDKKNYTFVENVNIMHGRENLKYKCVLPKGHKGTCTHTFNRLFIINPKTKKATKAFCNAIYSTPGNDDYVYKNRASRLHNIVLSSKEEKKIRDKNEKKKCAIPLKDASSPILMAQAYLDWLTYVLNIEDISQHINGENSDIMNMISKNKDHLIRIYRSKNRDIFDGTGHSICVITGKRIKFSDVSDPDRDNRVDIKDSDIQLGHNEPRSDKYVSIRGENLVPMTRRGNLIIGEKVFTDDEWVNELKQIIARFQ